MIIYNAGTQFFALKNDAEDHRKALGLKPGATHKLTINDRDQLAAFLNGLCEKTVKTDEQPADELEAVAAAIDVEPDHVPDYVPQFLLKPHQVKQREAQKAAGITTEQYKADHPEADI